MLKINGHEVLIPLWNNPLFQTLDASGREKMRKVERATYGSDLTRLNSTYYSYVQA